MEWEAGAVHVIERFRFQQFPDTVTTDPKFDDEIEHRFVLVREVILHSNKTTTDEKKQLYTNAEIQLEIRPNPYIFSSLPVWDQREQRYVVYGLYFSFNRGYKRNNTL